MISRSTAGTSRTAVVEPQSVGRVRPAGAQSPGEGRGHQHVGREAIDVVVDDLARQHDESDELGREPHGGLGGRGEAGRVRLLQRVRPRRRRSHPRASRRVRRLRRGDHLVGPPRIGHPALGHGHPVLGEVHTARRCRWPWTSFVLAAAAGGLPVRPELHEEKGGGAPDASRRAERRSLCGRCRREDPRRRGPAGPRPSWWPDRPGRRTGCGGPRRWRPSPRRRGVRRAGPP